MTLREVKENNLHTHVDEQNRIQGPLKCWHVNGQIRESSNYVDDKLVGVNKSWHDNGQLQGHCFLVNDALHGECHSWNDDGSTDEHRIYANGHETDEPIPTCDEDKFQLCLKYGHMEFIS